MIDIIHRLNNIYIYLIIIEYIFKSIGCRNVLSLSCKGIFGMKGIVRTPVTHKIVFNYWYDKTTRYAECELSEQKSNADLI